MVQPQFLTKCSICLSIEDSLPTIPPPCSTRQRTNRDKQEVCQKSVGRAELIAAATRRLWQARIEGMILENSHGRDARMVPELRTLVVRFDYMATLAITPRTMGVGCARSPVRRDFCGR